MNKKIILTAENGQQRICNFNKDDLWITLVDFLYDLNAMVFYNNIKNLISYIFTNKKKEYVTFYQEESVFMHVHTLKIKIVNNACNNN